MDVSAVRSNSEARCIVSIPVLYYAASGHQERNR
jgi:hypothetical protein